MGKNKKVVSTTPEHPSFIRKWLIGAQDLLFPLSCTICSATTSASGSALCADCLAQVTIVNSPLCTVCGLEMENSAAGDHLCGSCLRKKPPYDSARAVARYQEPVSTLLHTLKYQGDISVLPALQTVIDLLPQVPVGGSDRIIPVPLHIRRLRSRGFNQAKLLAELFFSDNREQILHDCLQRTQHTDPQTTLDGIARRKNLKGAFTVQKAEQIKGRSVFLVDDVFTTGTTVAECSKVLRAAGALSVQVLTVARVVVRA